MGYSDPHSCSANFEARQRLACGGSCSPETCRSTPDYNSNCSHSCKSYLSSPDSAPISSKLDNSQSLTSSPNSYNPINSKATKIGKLPRLCWFCGDDDVKLYKCGGCKRALYCSDRCVQRDWDVHGGWCLKKQEKLAKKSRELD